VCARTAVDRVFVLAAWVSTDHGRSESLSFSDPSRKTKDTWKIIINVGLATKEDHL
jgi:hypothetical protein